MKYIYLFIIASLLLKASSIDIYNNATIYRYIPTSKYLGFVSNISTKCALEPISTIKTFECDKDEYLCKEFKNITKLQHTLMEYKYKLKILNSVIDNINLNLLDANKIIENSSILAKEYVKYKTNSNLTTLRLKQLKDKFSSMTTSKYPTYLDKECKRELIVTMPASYISAKFIQRASFKDNNIIIERLISLRNRSGINIVAKRANIHFESYTKSINIPSFTPWILSVGKKRVYHRIKATSIPKGIKVTKNRFRDYSISSLILPSNNKEYKIKINTTTLPTTCQKIAYTYISNSVHDICSFKSSSPIEDDRWEITTADGSKIYTYGKYQYDKYILDRGVDKSISITKEPIPKKDKKSGLFGSKRKITDGYIITITNRTNNKKSLTVIDRVPYSKSDKVEVSIDSITGVDKKRVSKYGKLILKLNLKPMESRLVKVLFTITYDKNINIYY